MKGKRMTNDFIAVMAAAAAIIFVAGCDKGGIKPSTEPGIYGSAVAQTAIGKIDLMPDLPQPYAMPDWKAKAKSYDSYVFSWTRSGDVGPLIWLDQSHRNGGGDTFGLYTTVGDVRQGPNKAGGAAHEAINTLAAVLSGGLSGVDKTNQDGYNYVKMVQNYCATDNGWKIMLNGTSGYAQDWWYNVLPNILYYGICDLFPNVDGESEIQKGIADQFAAADAALAGNYGYSYFNYGQMKGYVTGIPLQQDEAAGHAYVLLCAYRKFGDASYLEHSKSAMDALLSQTESRFYEVVMPFGIYTAAYLDAVEGCNYDVAKVFNWIFDGCTSSTGRTGWGVIAGTWGDYDVSGLQGSLTDGGGYAFLMNSFEMCWPLVPTVKYKPEFAKAVGKWMLNNANACRLFYPCEIDDFHQYAPELKNITSDNVAYEGLRRSDKYGKASLKGMSPVALGDGPTWVSSNPTSTMFSLYSTSPVGIMGAIVSTTDVAGILRLDCNATDFYADRPYPAYLYYNPYDQAKTVTYNSSENCDLFDIVSRSYAAIGLNKTGAIQIPAKTAMVIYELPSGTRLKVDGTRITAAGKNVIAY